MDEIATMCRVCGITSRFNESLLDPSSKQLADEVANLFQLEINSSNSFPTTLCRSCKNKLIGLIVLKSICRKTHLHFCSVLKVSNTSGTIQPKIPRNNLEEILTETAIKIEPHENGELLLKSAGTDKSSTNNQSTVKDKSNENVELVQNTSNRRVKVVKPAVLVNKSINKVTKKELRVVLTRIDVKKYMSELSKKSEMKTVSVENSVEESENNSKIVSSIAKKSHANNQYSETSKSLIKLNLMVSNLDKCAQEIKEIEPKQNRYLFECNECSDKFDSFHSLAAHIDIVHKAANFKIICLVCSEIFSTLKSLSNHLLRHNIYTCSFCKKVFYTLTLFSDHMKLPHSVKKKYSLVTPECDTNSKQVPLVLKSQKSSENEKGFQTESATTSNDSQQSSSTSSESQDSGVENDFVFSESCIGNIYGCNECNDIYNSSYSIVTHVERNHSLQYGSPNFKLTCLLCTKIFSKLEDLLKHQISLKFKCKHCNESFHTSEVLNEHIKTIQHQLRDTNLLCKCIRCCASFDHGKDLQQHLINVHEFIYCSVCGNSFQANYIYDMHLDKCQLDDDYRNMNNGTTSFPKVSNRVKQITLNNDQQKTQLKISSNVSKIDFPKQISFNNKQYELKYKVSSNISKVDVPPSVDTNNGDEKRISQKCHSDYSNCNIILNHITVPKTENLAEIENSYSHCALCDLYFQSEAYLMYHNSKVHVTQMPLIAIIDPNMPGDDNVETNELLPVEIKDEITIDEMDWNATHFEL